MDAPYAALSHFRQEAGDRWHVAILQPDLDEDVSAGLGCRQHLDRQEKTTEGKKRLEERFRRVERLVKNDCAGIECFRDANIDFPLEFL